MRRVEIWKKYKDSIKRYIKNRNKIENRKEEL
ncbi:MAG: hypothetical protein K0R05_2878 [Anaerocolumna sp.]|jgi:hypothetical protein|nr:hypothetical protein [Anaerocolumna sp.]